MLAALAGMTGSSPALALTLAVLLSACAQQNDSGTTGVGGGESTTSSNTAARGGSSSSSFGSPTVGGRLAIDIASSSTPAPLPKDSNGLVAIPPERVKSLETNACDGWSVEAESAPSAIVFVVDVSGTMNSSTDATGDQSKYEVTRDALQRAIAKLPANLQVGLTFYPNMSNGGSRDSAADLSPCIDKSDDVAIATLGETGSEQRKTLLDALDSVEPNPKGATPTHDAFNIARDMLVKLPQNVAKHIAILTDGQPTLLEGCYGRAAPKHPEAAQPIIDGISRARESLDIKTFLVGSPGSEENQGTGDDARDWLSAAARAGGTEVSAPCADEGPNYCHFDMTQSGDFGAALSAALTAISNKVVIQCRYEIPEPPPGRVINPTATNLIYGDGNGNSFAILQNGAPDCTQGWRFVDSQIEICADTCQTITANARATMNLLFGCNTATVDSPLL
ncbi:MAG TPA: vWA domain-containing protein [Polyangiaceae bacterium]